MSDAHMPQASAPQVLCDVTSLLVEPSKMHSTRCPVHRPRYMCTSNTYNRYESGAFKLTCDWQLPVLEDYPRDHLRDIVSGFAKAETPIQVCNMLLHDFGRSPYAVAASTTARGPCIFHDHEDFVSHAHKPCSATGRLNAV